MTNHKKSCRVCQKTKSIKWFGKNKNRGDGLQPGCKSCNIWRQMNRRCNTFNVWNYRWYGGRGIMVCWRWHEDNPEGIKNYFNDVGESPKGKSLDRIDNDGNYEPENCRWATPSEQNYNRSNSVRFEYKGQLLSAAELLQYAVEGVSSKLIRDRVIQSGWAVERAVTTPLQRYKKRAWKYSQDTIQVVAEAKGSLASIGRKYDMSTTTVRRIKNADPSVFPALKTTKN